MSVMKASMTKDDNFRMSWLSRSLGQHYGMSSSMYVMRFVIAKLMIDFRRICLSIIDFN
jgi:hypothetical protein